MGATFKVVGQEFVPSLGPGGEVTQAARVTIETAAGVRRTVEFPAAEYTLEKVRARLTAEADLILKVQAL